MIYVALFINAFLAATLLPAYSEILFAALVAEGHNALALWAWATAGNTLGAVVNYLLARYFLRFQDRAWFPFRPTNLFRAQCWFQRYGTWSLTLSWMPVGGDALTFVAGLMRTDFWIFLALVAAGKAVRYGIVLWLVLQAT